MENDFNSRESTTNLQIINLLFYNSIILLFYYSICRATYKN